MKRLASREQTAPSAGDEQAGVVCVFSPAASACAQFDVRYRSPSSLATARTPMRGHGLMICSIRAGRVNQGRQVVAATCGFWTSSLTSPPFDASRHGVQRVSITYTIRLNFRAAATRATRHPSRALSCWYASVTWLVGAERTWLGIAETSAPRTHRLAPCGIPPWLV